MMNSMNAAFGMDEMVHNNGGRVFPLVAGALEKN